MIHERFLVILEPEILIISPGIVGAGLDGRLDNSVPGGLPVTDHAEYIGQANSALGLCDSAIRPDVNRLDIDLAGVLDCLPEIDGFVIRKPQVVIVEGISQHLHFNLILGRSIQVNTLILIGRMPHDVLAIHHLLEHLAPLGEQAGDGGNPAIRPAHEGREVGRLVHGLRGEGEPSQGVVLGEQMNDAVAIVDGIHAADQVCQGGTGE